MMTPLQTELINRVLHNLERNPTTQKTLAHNAGITDKHLTRLLKGHDEGRLKTWQKILDASNTPPTEKPPPEADKTSNRGNSRQAQPISQKLHN